MTTPYDPNRFNIQGGIEEFLAARAQQAKSVEVAADQQRRLQAQMADTARSLAAETAKILGQKGRRPNAQIVASEHPFTEYEKAPGIPGWFGVTKPVIKTRQTMMPVWMVQARPGSTTANHQTHKGGRWEYDSWDETVYQEGVALDSSGTLVAVKTSERTMHRVYDYEGQSSGPPVSHDPNAQFYYQGLAKDEDIFPLRIVKPGVLLYSQPLLVGLRQQLIDLAL